MTATGGHGLRIGLVGCGRIAEQGYAPAIAGLEGIEMAAVADPVAQRAHGMASRFSSGGPEISVHEDCHSLLSEADVDAVVIASPVERHLRDAEAASKAGIPCLVEKPPAPDLAGATALAELSPAPLIGFNRRFAQGREALARVPTGGAIDLDLLLEYRRDSWRPHGDLGETLLDLGPHLIDLALLLTGSEDATVLDANLSPGRASLEIETARGHARLRCATDRPYREELAIRRPGGERLAKWQTGGLARGIADRLLRRQSPLVHSLSRQLQAFAIAATGGLPGLLATAEDGRRAMAVIERARRFTRQEATA